MSIKELSAKFAIPERTVYYKVTNTPSIRTKKEGRSKLANVVDFAKACNIPLQPLQNPLQMEEQKEAKNTFDTEIAELQKSNDDLQNEIEVLSDKKNNLEKYNRNLEENAQTYSLALIDERNEKKERIEKCDSLQAKTESYVKRYYLLL